MFKTIWGSDKAVASVAATSKIFIRGKQKAAMTPSTQRIVNQLSALSASRKQPKLLSLCNEDLIKNRTITNAWNVYKRKLFQKRDEQFEKQYNSIKNAMEDLKQTSPELFELANAKEQKRFPLEMRIPTDFPPNQPWVYNYAPKK
ncbi:uncharacterized protein CANTADRAFT_339126 [Suhomyces tanzawaensis NRRL Y-17324]|uniref:Large ribosomal subunit protein mL40 n=1 Tax=Suhomyces tanzawaensis NRRL Y-17324 TaxID=984487 RepID=A0A1E4SNA3_9ASCO|nr:uncharacterized protein CANTADRAFT_339126 [Suhomyces tanzawaensis NRRL Y-17324]ODV80968.1 hypothetical protein CANTADRAFT_339126 [Suhomyces tanzawaensis NRRL Y-17324]